VFYSDGEVQEGIFKDNRLIDGRKWQLNDYGSYDYYQVTKGKLQLVEIVAELPGSQK
jgi:hypothetical protein